MTSEVARGMHIGYGSERPNGTPVGYAPNRDRYSC